MKEVTSVARLRLQPLNMILRSVLSIVAEHDSALPQENRSTQGPEGMGFLSKNSERNIERMGRKP
jgi:hypothetical protein